MQVADLTIARKHLRSFIERQSDGPGRPSHETAALMKLKEAATLIEEARPELARAEEARWENGEETLSEHYL
jgi:hypothetical protein